MPLLHAVAGCLGHVGFSSARTHAGFVYVVRLKPHFEDVVEMVAKKEKLMLDAIVSVFFPCWNEKRWRSSTGHGSER